MPIICLSQEYEKTRVCYLCIQLFQNTVGQNVMKFRLTAEKFIGPCGFVRGLTLNMEQRDAMIGWQYNTNCGMLDLDFKQPELLI